ncbi:5-oxoprolinase subunit B family protein [Nocardia jejuensis]|uniref:5-oxoprolinase subunit B family protein n=1 Tax=Nocardia jejuensis TaxID=328049 RepID=UPI001FE1953C
MISEFVQMLRPRPAGVLDVLPAAETVLVTLSSGTVADTVRKRLHALLDHLATAADAATVPPPLPVRSPLRAEVSPEVVRSNGFPQARDSSPAARRPDRLEYGATQPGSPPRPGTSPIIPDEPVLIPVRYDGEDLAEVAELLGIPPAEVIAQHTGTVWRCAFVGFAPGFGYLESADGRLTVPRRTRSRTSIPAGAVALAGGYSAIYPRRSPGGWQLIGTTDLTLWDVDRDPPALVRAATRVRFVNAAEYR